MILQASRSCSDFTQEEIPKDTHLTEIIGKKINLIFIHD